MDDVMRLARRCGRSGVGIGMVMPQEDDTIDGGSMVAAIVK